MKMGLDNSSADGNSSASMGVCFHKARTLDRVTGPMMTETSPEWVPLPQVGKINKKKKGKRKREDKGDRKLTIALLVGGTLIFPEFEFKFF